MGNSILQPKSLDEWLLLLDQTPIPVHTGQKERIQRVMASPNASLSEIAQVISTAPSIALTLFREANRSRNSLVEPAHNLTAVLKRLGMSRCIQLVSQLPDDAKQPIPVALRQVWLIGQHANVQANALFARKMARLWQNIHWGSLLFFAPVWPLLVRHPELLDIWQQRVLGNQEPAHRVERELLGVPLIKLCCHLAERWALPRWIIDGYAALASNHRLIARALHLAKLHEQPLLQQRKLDEQKDLNLWLSRPANSIALASGLALASHDAWANQHTLRWQLLMSLYLRRPLAQIQNQTHITAVEHARILGQTELWHPAQALLWPWEAQRFNRQVDSTLDATTTQAGPTAHPPSAQQLQLWRQHSTHLLAKPSPFRNTLQLLTRYAELFAFCNLPRIVVMTIQHQTAQLIPIYQLGYEFTLQQPLSTSLDNPVIKHVLNSDRSLQLNARNSAKIAPHLQGLLAVSGAHDCLLGSIHLNQRAVLLIMADAQPFLVHPDSVKAFNASNRILEQALVTMRSRT